MAADGRSRLAELISDQRTWEGRANDRTRERCCGKLVGILLKPSSVRGKASAFVHVSKRSESAALAHHRVGFPVKEKILCREKSVLVKGKRPST